MMIYNWQQKDWPHFNFTLDTVQEELLAFFEKVGRVSGMLEGLPEEIKQDAIIDIILAEAIKTSEIEGEYPSRKDVLSSIRRNLGLQYSPATGKDQSAAGLGELMIDVRKTAKDPLTKEKLFAWHTLLAEAFLCTIFRFNDSEIFCVGAVYQNRFASPMYAREAHGRE